MDRCQKSIVSVSVEATQTTLVFVVEAPTATETPIVLQLFEQTFSTERKQGEIPHSPLSPSRSSRGISSSPSPVGRQHRDKASFASLLTLCSRRAALQSQLLLAGCDLLDLKGGHVFLFGSSGRQTNHLVQLNNGTRALRENECPSQANSGVITATGQSFGVPSIP